MSLERASPADLRQALDLAHHLTKIGMLFVPVPVLNRRDHAQLVEQVKSRVDTLEHMAESPYFEGTQIDPRHHLGAFHPISKQETK